MSRQINLLVDSDLHFDHGHIRADKKHNVISMLDQQDVDAVCLVGDITNGNHPSWGQSLTCSWTYDDCTQQFINQYFTPLARQFDVYVVPGNHDREASFPWTICHQKYWEIDAFCGQHYGSVRYTADLNHGVKLIAMGVYPNAKALAWFESLHLDKSTPLILMWHYSMHPDEAYSDWWSTQEKDACWNVIKHYNVVCILVGHLHETRLRLWNGIPSIKAAGPGYARVIIDLDTLIDGKSKVTLKRIVPRREAPTQVGP